ncbi:MAG: Gldg family protein [Cyanobacteria bacterium Co-bin8]|nr:Gldg family protein [Cyanobacteria bacterium Co-bin8]
MKTIVAYRQYLKYLALLGLLLSTAGLVVGVASSWGWLSAGLLFGGLGLLLVGLAFSDVVQGRFWQQRSTEAGANALIATLAVLIILALLNVLAVRYSSRIDVTENQIFTLAPQSRQLVQALEQPARAVIFDVAQNAQDRQLLESYQRAGNNFAYEYVDPYANPQLAQRFEATRPGMAFLELGDRREFLQNISPQERLSERTLTNTLDQLVSDRTLTVYFTQGHREFPIDGSEAGFSQAVAALEEKNYTVRPLNLAETSQVPEDASLVVVAGPAQEFFAPEVAALQSYLDRGGSLMLLIDPRTNPGLGNLLDRWGVTLDERIVLDTSGAGQLVGLGPAAPLVTDYGSHPITQDFRGGRSFYPLARPVEVEALPDITAVPLLQTNPQSRAEAISESGELQYDPNAVPEGSFTLGVALSRPVDAAAPDQAQAEPEAEEAAPEARMVVIGNASFATDGLFDQQLNGDVFLNAVSWLGQQNDAVLSIRPRTVTNRRITMTVQQQLGLGVFSLLVLPLVGFAMALVLWLRRR